MGAVVVVVVKKFFGSQDADWQAARPTTPYAPSAEPALSGRTDRPPPLAWLQRRVRTRRVESPTVETPDQGRRRAGGRGGREPGGGLRRH